MVNEPVRKLHISKQANKFIKSLPEKQRSLIKDAVKKLIANETAGLNIKKLHPHPKEFRLRVGNVRILFKADRQELFLFKAGYRQGVYK